jgi:hypothetical protein
MTSDFLHRSINRNLHSWVETVHQRLEQFLFPAVSDHWLGILRLGLGIQVTLYSLSLRADWNDLFGADGTAVISRDLTEAILSADGRFIPRLGWLVTIGNQLGFREESIVGGVWVALLFAGSCLIVGLLCRPAAAIAWFLHLCAVKSSSLQAYGMDNFTTIGLFYLMLAPLPDRYALDWRIWQPRPRDPNLLGFFQRVLQFHLCIIYFFTGLIKSVASDWWNGTGIWRSLTCAPFNVISPGALASWRYVLGAVGIAVLIVELGYPFFIWPKRTRAIWLLCIVGMHAAIALAMGLYLFSLIMIVLNLAAFGPTLGCFNRAKSPRAERVFCGAS